MIHLGDCLTALQCLTRRHAWVTDPPANIGFMGRKWDKASAAGLWQPRYVHPSANLTELRSDNEFTEYWAERFGMMNDLTEDDGVAIVWALPRTQHLTQAALRYAGWKVPFVFDHIFGQGWNKNGGHLKPGHESWLIATKGHYELGIEACRIPRGSMSAVPNGGRMGYGGGSDGYAYEPNPNGAHPIDAGLSHCEACVRVGERKVKGAKDPDRFTNTLRGKTTYAQDTYTKNMKGSRAKDFSDGNGLESVAAYQCLAGCSCGRSWLAMAGGKAPRCECGEQAQWACPVAALDEQSGQSKSSSATRKNGAHGGVSRGKTEAYETAGHDDSGGASRFFHNFHYFAKAGGRTDEQGVSSGERHAGCENLFWRANKKNPFGFDRVTREEWEGLEPMAPCPRNDGKSQAPSVAHRGGGNEGRRARGNGHPTVKSLMLMMHLVKLAGALIPRDEPFRVGDLCTGSGGTAIACQLLGADFDGAELYPEAIEIANARLAFWRGVNPMALHEFVLTGEMPITTAAKPKQGSLFT